MVFVPRPDPSFEEEWDVGDPYSCIAAGAAKVPSRLEALTAKVAACYGQPPEKLDELAAADLKSTISALWEVWYANRHLNSRPDHKLADWAARQSAALGDSSILDAERREGRKH